MCHSWACPDVPVVSIFNLTHSWACSDVPLVNIFNFTHSWACPDVPLVSSFNLIRWGAAAMRPLATSAAATCFVAMAGIRTGLRWRLTTSGVKRTSSLRCIQTARGHSSTSPSKLRSLTGNLVFCVLSCTHTHREKKIYSPQSKQNELMWQSAREEIPTTHNRLIARETFTHSHPSWSSDILYQLSPSTTIHSILLVQFMCLTVVFHKLSPGPLWSSSWSGNLYFMLHAFLHPIVTFFLATRAHTIAACAAVVPMLCKRQWVAVASAGPYASLHLTPDR